MLAKKNSRTKGSHLAKFTDIQAYQFELDEPLNDEDDSDWFGESGIIEESARRTRNPSWCSSELCVLQMTSRALTFSSSRRVLGD